MAKRATKQSKAAKSANPPKRAPTEELQSSANSKRPRRLASTKSTPTKSRYFEGDSDSEDKESIESSDHGDGSGYEETDEDVAPTSESEGDGGSDISGEDDNYGRAKGSRTFGSVSRTKSQKMKDKADFEPGVQVIIKKPKAKGPGSTPYQDDSVHPNTMQFLRDLKSNNNRQWLKLNDPDYRQSEQDWKTYVESLTEKIASLDETVPELPVKDVVFRIYRDVRFSKDQTPYKTNFSAAWSRTGRKGPYAAYYVQIQPNGGSLVAGGLWMPEAPALARMRQSVDRHPERLKAVLMEARLRREFLKGAPSVEPKAVKAFCAQNADSALKTKPKGYDAEHENIDLLRLKSFTMARRLSDAEMLDRGSLERVSGLIACLVPFITYLNSVVMPDQAPSDDSDDDNGDDDDGDETGSGSDA